MNEESSALDSQSTDNEKRVNFDKVKDDLQIFKE